MPWNVELFMIKVCRLDHLHYALYKSQHQYSTDIEVC